MGRSWTLRGAALGLVAILLCGCAAPYSLSPARLDYDQPQQAGPIQFTDPKLYKREALINERRDEVEYLRKQLKDSETATIEPEIIRDLETVQSFSAALGVRYDPAAALNYKRDVETSDIQQEISLLRLQAELARVKRSVELLNAELPNQTASSDTVLGSQTTTAAADVQAAVTPAATQELLTAIAGLQTSLIGRLDATPKAVAKATASASPIDTLRDRGALRSQLNSAIAAASLDELHDRNGAALFRLNLSATVLPPPKAFNSVLGALRMEVTRPDWTEASVAKLYDQWLDYLNRGLNVAVQDSAPLRFRENLALQGLSSGGDLFDIAYYYYPIAPAPAPGCNGVSFMRRDIAGCGRLMIAAARPKTFGVAQRNRSELASRFAIVDAAAHTYKEAFLKARVVLAAKPAIDCLGRAPTEAPCRCPGQGSPCRTRSTPPPASRRSPA